MRCVAACASPTERRPDGTCKVWCSARDRWETHSSGWVCVPPDDKPCQGAGPVDVLAYAEEWADHASREYWNPYNDIFQSRRGYWHPRVLESYTATAYRYGRLEQPYEETRYRAPAGGRFDVEAGDVVTARIAGPANSAAGFRLWRPTWMYYTVPSGWLTSEQSRGSYTDSRNRDRWQTCGTVQTRLRSLTWAVTGVSIADGGAASGACAGWRCDISLAIADGAGGSQGRLTARAEWEIRVRHSTATNWSAATNPYLGFCDISASGRNCRFSHTRAFSVAIQVRLPPAPGI